MSIILVVGNVGSGKSATTVREMAISKRTTYSNLHTSLDNQIDISSDMIIKKEIVDTKKKRDGTVEPVYEMKMNVDFWKEVPKPCDIILDEFHNIFSSRRSMSKQSQIFSEWLALIRRSLGSVGGITGNLYIITQLTRRADVIAREMAHQVRYCICHFVRGCRKCGFTWNECSENPEQTVICPICDNLEMYDFDHKIEMFHFVSVESLEQWRTMGIKTYYRHYFINDIGDYFPLYNTLQWENMFSD